jgi:hypothetical protein
MTLAADRADIVNQLDAVTGIKVYDSEPATVTIGGDIPVTVFCTGITRTEHLFAIRVYSPGTPTVAESQTRFDTILPAIEDGLSVNWGPVVWDIEWVDELQACVATWLLSRGREDF